jgi:putative ABC transport system permease protein
MADLALSPRWRKMLRDTWLHKSRTLLVVIAVAIGMVCAGTLLNAWALIGRATAESFLASHPPSATLRANKLTAALLAQVRALPAVTAARLRGHASATAEVDGVLFSAELFAIADFAARDIGAVAFEGASRPPGDAEISIEKSSLNYSGAELGGSAVLRLGQSPARKLRISGIAHDFGLPPGWMDHVVYGFVTPTTLAALGATSVPNELQILVRDTADRDAVRRIAHDVKSLLERGGADVVDIAVPVPGQHPHAAQMDSLMLTQGAFGLLTLVVASFLIVNLITAMLAGQTREIAIMKALGATGGQIAAMYFAFVLVLGLFAVAISIPLAILIGRPYAALKADMLNFSVAGFAIPWWSIALQLLVGCLVPVLAAAWPIARACRLSVSVALHDAGIATEKGAHLSRRIALPGLSRPLLLSLSNAFRRSQRTLLTVIALAAGGAVFIGADNLQGSVLRSVEMMSSAERYDLRLRLAEPQPAPIIEASAAAVAGVERAQGFATDNAALVHAAAEQGDAFTLIGVPPDSPMLGVNVARGRWLDARDRNALVVSERLLRDEPGMTPGADVRLAIDGATSIWHVVGVDPTVVRDIAYAPLATLQQLHGDDRVSLLAVATRGADAATKLDVIMRLRSELERQNMRVASSQLLSETRRAAEDHLLMVVEFLGAMAWVMIAVGGMGLASTMSLAVLERTREIGVLRAIGARHVAIMRMIQAEGIVIVLLAWLVSLPLSAPMSVGLALAFGKVMFDVPVQVLPNARAAFAWLGLVLVGSLLACAWPGMRAMRITTAAALNYE